MSLEGGKRTAPTSWSKYLPRMYSATAASTLIFTVIMARSVTGWLFDCKVTHNFRRAGN